MKNKPNNTCIYRSGNSSHTQLRTPPVLRVLGLDTWDVVVTTNVQDRSSHMSFILKGSQISAL
jgi:hypothetical protein